MALLLPGCGAQDTNSPPPQQPTELSAPLGSDGGFTLSLEAGRTTAALSGTLADGTLPAYDLSARQYTHGDHLTIYVLEALPGKSLEEAGEVCGVRTTDPAQATPRGLKVGDSLDRANFLYGPFEEVQEGLYWLRNGVGLTGHCSLYLEAEGDRITAISLYTRFWGPAQIVEPGQEPDGAQASSGHPQ